MLPGKEVEDLDVAAVIEDGSLWLAIGGDGTGQELAGPLGLDGPRSEHRRELRGNRVLLTSGDLSRVHENGNRESGSIAQQGPGPYPQLILHVFAAEVTQADVD